MLRSKKPSINSLHTRRLDALSVFTEAAQELQEVAAEYRALALDARDVAAVQQGLADNATHAATLAEDQASKILSVLT